MQPSRPKIFVIPAGWSGCAFWRLRMPLAKLEKVGSKLDILLAKNGEKSIQMREIEQHTKDAQIVVLQAPGHRDAMELINFYKLKGKKVVVDYDDYSFDLSPSNPRYAELGTKECELSDGHGGFVYQWKHGHNGFDLHENLAKYNGFVECVKAADLVTTTTEYLARKFRPLNANVKILPNSIDFDLWKPIARKPGRESEIRIGWFGGDSHRQDLWVFRDVFPKLIKRYPHLKVVIQGPMVPSWGEMFKDIPPENLDWRGWVDLKYYTLFLAANDFDIGVCPLDPSLEFNRCKSSIKMFEFAALKVPTICQDMEPYSVTAKLSGGILATTAEDWERELSRLIESPELREVVGENGYNDVLTRWNLEKNCRLWEDAYLSLLGEPAHSGLSLVGDWDSP